MFGSTRRYYRDITKRILVLRNLSLYGSTRKYYKTSIGTSYLILVLRSISWSYRTYTCTTELILVFQILDLYYRTYTCISNLILVLQNLYLYFRSYTCLTEHILVLRNIYLSYGSYTCVTELIIVLRILFLCEGTRRYDKSEQIRIILHTRSDQTYVDTYQIWTLVHSRYRSQQIHIPDSYRFRTYPNRNRLSVYIISIFRVTLARRYP